MAKLIRRNLFYSSEKVLKPTHSNAGIKQISGVTPPDPRFRGRGERGGKKSRREEVGGRGRERGEKGKGLGEGKGGEKVQLGDDPPPQ